MSESWSYYSANTIQISGDLSSKYFPNSLIYIIQGGSAKFFLITAVNVVSSNTRLTVSGGGLYTLTADAITAHYYNAEGAAPLLPVRFRPQAEIYSSSVKEIPLSADIFQILDSANNYVPRKLSFYNLKLAMKTYEMSSLDNRSVDPIPESYTMGAKLEFRENTVDGLSDGGVYHTVLTIRNWSDWSGGNARQLGFTDHDNIYIRGILSGTEWGPWVALSKNGHTHNIFSGYDVIVYQSGGLTIAENGWTHEIIDSGTIGPTTNTRVLNAAIAACPANGSLYIGSGTYYLYAATSCTAGPAGYLTYNVALPISKNMHITGAGIGATILMLAAGQHYTDHPALIMYAYHPYSDGGFGVAYTAFSLRRMTFDGNVSGQTIWYYDGAGLFLAGSMRYNARYEDLEFKNSACHGFYSGNHGAGWEVDGVFKSIYSHDNAYYDQIDNPERCTLNGWISYNCGYYATEIGLAIDTYTSGRRSITCSDIDIRKGGLYLFSYESETFNDDSVIQISNLHIDARETSHSALWIQHIGNIFIDGGFIRANPATNYAVWLQHAEVNLSDVKITGLRGIVSVASTVNTLECHDCNIISESHCILPVTGDTYRFHSCQFTTNDDAAYLLAAAGGVTLELFSCTGGANGYGAIIISASATVSHTGTYRLGLETDGYGSVADAETIAHGLKITPRWVTVQASVEGTIATPSSIGSSTFTVDFSGVTTTQTVYWHARY
ncbi:hypothetical protein [Bacteroides sp.]|uniref:hypothetical protein n=1 Tax=Bacteroides sp. TaxID=29523 RepID=UPI0026258777|nr:hypothetical protein [Bacteroides sp.]MDD3040721.1 hypothetical protein [Bacteroides sp.]